MDYKIWFSITYPHYNPFGCVSYNRIGHIGTDVCMKCDHQIEVSLIRIWFSLFPHIIRRGFTEVESTHSCLRDLIRV